MAQHRVDRRRAGVAASTSTARPGRSLLVATPVALGLLAGVLAVQWSFGSVHAITLGFGATLIGEAVDYPNYVLVQTAGRGAGRDASASAARWRWPSSRRWRARWPWRSRASRAWRSSACSRWSASWWPASQRAGSCPGSRGGQRARKRICCRCPRAMLTLRSRRTRALTPGRHGRGRGRRSRCCIRAWWERDLASISPIPAELRARDAQLRREIGAPDVSYLVATRGATEDEALASADALGIRAADAGKARGADPRLRFAHAAAAFAADAGDPQGCAPAARGAGREPARRAERACRSSRMPSRLSSTTSRRRATLRRSRARSTRGLHSAPSSTRSSCPWTVPGWC